MKVYIVSYRGTIYGVFDSAEKAADYIRENFDEYFPVGSEYNYTVYEVQ